MFSSFFQLVFKANTIGGVPLVIWFVLSAALFFMYKLKFVNIRMWGTAIKLLSANSQCETKNSGKDKVSPLKAFFVQAAATLGIGNLAGSVFALCAGGSGVILWIIFFAIVMSIMKFAEIIMGQLYKNVDKHGNISGGTMYALRGILKKKNMSKLGVILGFAYALMLCVAVTSWSGFQLNQVVGVLTGGKKFFDATSGFSFASVATTAIIIFSVGIILSGGVVRVANSMSAVVSIMVLMYFSLILWVICAKYHDIPKVLLDIYNSAFNLKTSVIGIATPMLVSMQRTMLSTEAGLGTASIPHAHSSTAYMAQPAFLGLIDTMLVASVVSLGAFALLLLGFDNSHTQTGVCLMMELFKKFNPIAGYIIVLVVFFFGFTTLTGNGYYVRSGIISMIGTINVKIFAFFYAIVATLISIFDSGFLINTIDSMNYGMLFLNVTALLLCSSEITKQLDIFLSIRRANAKK